jgi:tRNA nucleotidyltransferase (CCA-adding enzyme)
MEIYMVGGAVRDRLLGLPVQDRDWVVVGATPEQMVAQGYLPVGRDFPVFLHPRTREEYALARTERKTARGYRGFAIHAAPDVTLEQDLARRDLTINAIAIRAHLSGPDSAFALTDLVDPFHGQRDLAEKVLRHVTDAFREDPVRILRVARLSARFTDFQVAPQTLQLMRDMVQHGEVDHLVAERVWQELARGLMEEKPSRMFDVLQACGALARLMPELNALWAQPRCRAQVLRRLDTAARLQTPLPVRFACLTQESGSDSPSFLPSMCERLRVPTDCSELAELVARERGNMERSAELGSADLMRLLERCDAIRQPERFALALLACECDARAHPDRENEAYPPARRLASCLQAARGVATQEVARQAQARGVTGPGIGALIHAARVAAVQERLQTNGNLTPAI